jgi:hypothetical protein
VQGKIVTLDLTAGEYELTINGEQITIDTGSSSDLIGSLRTVAEGMYGGQLGYLIVNIGEQSLQSGFVDGRQLLLEALIGGLSDHETAGDELLELAGAPVRVVEPRVDSRSALETRAAEYYALDTSKHSRIADIEVQHDRILDREDWPRIALTERQEGSDAESDTHYLWKAALVDGLARKLYTEYKAVHVDSNEDLAFSQFVSTELVNSNTLKTETPPDGSDNEESPVPDVHVDTSETWVWNAIREFVPTEVAKGTDIILEFETGYQEGAFNHRKLRETVNKYNPSKQRWIGVVVPPRLLYASSRRARLTRELVESWPHERSASAEAQLCVPRLDKRSCDELEAASGRIGEWFGDKNE